MIRRSLFTSARIKLTFMYVLIFLCISGFISGMFYYRTSQVLENEYERMEQRIQLTINGQVIIPRRAMMRQIQPEDLDLAKEKIITQLIYINSIIVVIVGISGYFLSGITLAPIQKALEEQKRFVADAAHELRTPITTLKTTLEVNLMEKKLNRSTKQILTENLEDVVSLETITNNLLRLSKLDDHTLEILPIKLNPIVQNSIKHMSPLAKKKAIKLIYKEENTNLTINGNEIALNELINILLDNAIKYSPSKTEITTTTLQHRQHVRISITDQGIGIDKEHLDHIFDRFYRADTARFKDKDQSGYGLGLSIAKRIVDELHGDIQVKSQPDKGTTFTVSLPKA